MNQNTAKVHFFDSTNVREGRLLQFDSLKVIMSLFVVLFHYQNFAVDCGGGVFTNPQNF